jgi:hypothetical protein
MTESLVKHISGLHEDLNYLSYAFQAAAYGYRFPDMHGSGPGCNVNDMNDCYRISYQAPSDFAGYPSDNADTIDRLLDTLPVAIDMILEPKCRLLFGAPSADLFSVWIQLRVGPIRAEGNPNIGALNARTAPVGAVLAGGERTSGFEITFNNSGFTDFNRERNPRIRAITVIHEFGHGWAYPNLGLGGSAIAPDGGDPGASRANFGLARDACL